MSSGCGCGSYTPINRIINATVCQNYFIIIDVACSNPTNISTPEFGTAEVYGPGQIIYTHSDSLYTSETDSFTFRCNGVTYTVNLVIEQTIPPTTTIVTFSASGSCEVGNPTYTWTIPDCATLVEGYNIHDQTVQVIVPMFDPENPTAVCVLTVDVCCDYCHDCCKCETIEWYPPNCTLECGEDPNCNCNHLPCHIYDPISGNCIPTCEVDEVCCSGTVEQSKLYSINEPTAYVEATFQGSILDTLSIFITVTGVDAITNYYILGPRRECTTEMLSTNCEMNGEQSLDFSGCDDAFELSDSPTTIGENVTATIVSGNTIFIFYDGISQVCDRCTEFSTMFLITFKIIDGIYEAVRNIIFFMDTDPDEGSFDPEGFTVFMDEVNGIPLCLKTALVPAIVNSFCAECCTTDDCYIAGCPNTNMICYNNACYCILNNGSYIPAPTDGTCCPNCTNDTVPKCYECIDGTVVPPDDCPIGQVYDWDTCTCTGTSCSEFNCLNPESPTYCPEQPGCGCVDVPNSTVDVCIPCDTVSCTANPDCPLGCYCDDGTCQENPCFSFDCVNTNPNVYCPTQEEGCFCDETECLPCNSVSCTGDIDCPYGCVCDENIQTCIGNPCATYQCENPSAVTYCPPQVDCGCDEINNCIPCNTVSCTATVDCPEGCACIDNTCNGPCGTLQVNCDAYYVHNENDLVLSYSCSPNGDSYLITPSLGLEPNFIFNNGNVTWWINTNNDTDGWLEVTGTLNNIYASPAITIVNGQLKIFYSSNIEYINVMCLVNGRKVWYRLNTITEAGIGCAYSDFQLGGAFLCGEIFTIESNSGINWFVDEWFVSGGTITYSTLGENGILVLECAGTELVSLSAEVSAGECTITTCPTSYLCNCVGSQDCALWSLNLHGNFDQNASVWTVAVDVLYNGVTGFAWYDCSLPSQFQFPTQYSCHRCGANPYHSYYITNPTGDDLINSPTPPFCFNPTANNSCSECLCGFTFYNAQLFDYDGVKIKVIPTGIDPQICFQTNIAGTNASGACCVSACINLEFVPECNLQIQNSNFDCVSYGNYALTFDVIGSFGNISLVTINNTSTPFELNGNTVTVLVESNALQALTISVTDTFACTASTIITTPCCEIDVKIEPIDCATFDPTNNLFNKCQACNMAGDFAGSGTVVAYDITLLNIPTGYTIAYTSNDTLLTGITNILVTSENFVISMTDPTELCENFEIYSLTVIDQNGCEIPITTQCSGECYAGLWTSVGSKISEWSTNTKTSWINYKFEGISIDNVSYNFAGSPIDLKAIICQAHKDSVLGTYSVALGCSGTTYSVTNCIPITGNTGCYLNPSNCINNNLPSPIFKQYHNLVNDYLYNAWACKLYANGVSGTPTTYLLNINQVLNNLGYPNFNITKLVIPSTGNGTATLPDNSLAPQLGVYKYMIISTERYPMNLISPIRTPYTTTNPQKPKINIGCESGNCDGPSGITGYNCDDCTLLISGGEYVTSADCINQCPTGCEILYSDILPDNADFNVTTINGTPYSTAPTSLLEIIGNANSVYVSNENYGTMIVSFDIPPIAACANFLKAEITIVGIPNADGWANALNIGSDYAPILGNESFNSIVTKYDVGPSAQNDYYAPGSSVYLGYSHAFSYDAYNNPTGGTLVTDLTVNLSGITTNPNTWTLELIGIGSLTGTVQIDVLESVTMNLYTDCSECPSGLSYWSCDNNCEEIYIDGIYTTQDDCLLNCINLSCSADILSVTSETVVDLSGFNLRIRGKNWADINDAQDYFNSTSNPLNTDNNPTLIVDNFLIQGEDIYLYISGVTSLGNYTFYNDIFITEFEDLTGWLTYLNPFSFMLTTSLNLAILPAVEVLDYGTFDLSNISYIDAPNVFYIGQNALSSTNLVSGSFEYCLTASTAAFKDSYQLKYINLPLCQVIGNKCFQNCNSLEILNIPILLEMGATTGYQQVLENCFNPNLIITTSDVIENAGGVGIPDEDLGYYTLACIGLNPSACTISNNIIYLPIIT